MIEREKLSMLKNAVVEKRALETTKKSLSENKKAAEEAIDRMIDQGDSIEKMRSEVKKRDRFAQQASEKGAEIRGLQKRIESIIMGEEDVEGQLTIDGEVE